MSEEEKQWLIGANGILAGSPDGSWERLGNYRYTVNQVLRDTGSTLTVATGNGLWRVPVDRSGTWVQLHDETLTEVATIVRSPVGIVAGSPYGVAVCRDDDARNPRWQSLTEHLRVNARFTNTILIDPADPTRWLVGTEGGLIIGQDNGSVWSESELNESPVRSVIHAKGRFWAASDKHGLLRSVDGCQWESVEGVPGPAFTVACQGDWLVVGTMRGVVVCEPNGPAKRLGANILVRCLGIDPANPDMWVAGADPGGLWVTYDAGKTWKNTGVVTRVRTVVAPEGGEE